MRRALARLNSQFPSYLLAESREHAGRERGVIQADIDKAAGA